MQPGDKLDLTVWDSTNSVLTAENQRVTRLQDLVVASNGTVFLPYAGKVSVMGLTPELARDEIQKIAAEIVPSAQIQLTLAEGRNNAVDLVSGVSKPGNYRMPDRSFTVLGLLAMGGGVSHNLNNPQVRLARGGTLYGISFERLLESPKYDTLLRGGDRVYVEEDNRYFLSFGATSKEDLFIFTRDDISAMDAVSMIGGLNDAKADPGGLLVLRDYPSAAVRSDGRGPSKERVVFSVNLNNSDGIFSARKFQINSQDLLIATESPINDVLTISNIVGNFVGVFNATNNLYENVNE
ncbi:MAG: polysaccharide biosynthesis/export family protein [Paracoccaceae bacterium]